MLQAITADLLIMLFGLGSAWFGLSLILRASRSRVPGPGASWRRPPSRRATRLRGSAFIAMGLSLIGYGVTGLRHAHGGHLTVPPNAPLLDQVT